MLPRGVAFYAVPVETLAFLFTDIEGSTALLQRVGEGAYARVLADHHELIRSALAAHDGTEVDTQGDAFFAVFSSPRRCVAAVLEMQQAIGAHAWPGGEQVRLRMGIHCGEAEQTMTGLVGLEVHRAARVAAVAYGGQVLVSESAAVLVRDRCRRPWRSPTWECTGSRTWVARNACSSSRHRGCKRSSRRCGRWAIRR